MGDRLTRLLPQIGWGALVAAAFLVPVASSRWVVDAFSLPKVTIWWIASLLAIAGMAAWAAAHRAWPIPRMRALVPLAVLGGWTLLATILSPQPIISAMGQYGRYDGLAELVCGAIVALAVVAFVGHDPGRLAAIVVAFAAGGAVSLAVVVAQGFGWSWTGGARTGGAVDAVGAIVGQAGNANFSGAMLALAVPFALGLRSRLDRSAPRAAMTIGAVALVGGVVWTETRGGILAAVAGVAAFGLLAPELLPKAVRYVAIGAFAAGLVVVGVSSTSAPVPGPRPSGAERLLAKASLGERQNIWAGAAAMVREAPVVGVGPDAFGLRFPYERPARAGHRSLIAADEAHDVYLDRAATAGLPALAAYLWLVGSVGFVAWRGRRTVAPEHRWLLASFGASFAGYLAQGAFSIDVPPLAFWSWMSIGAVLALVDPSVVARRTVPEPSARPVPTLATAGIVAALAVALSVVIRPAVADHHARAGLTAAAADRPLDAYAAFAEASSWLGHEPRYHERQASTLLAAAAADGTDPDLRSTLIDEALIAYDRALDRAPDDGALRRAQADAHLLAAEAATDPSVAGEHLAAAIRIDRELIRATRADDDLHLGLGRALEARADRASGAAARRDRDLAGAQYQAARSYVPDRLAALEGLARLAVDEGRLQDARRYLVLAAQEGRAGAGIDAAIEEIDRRIEAGG